MGAPLLKLNSQYALITYEANLTLFVYMWKYGTLDSFPRTQLWNRHKGIKS